MSPDMLDRHPGRVLKRPPLSMGQRGGRLPDWLPAHHWLLRFSACTRRWIYADDWAEESDRPIAARRGNNAIRDVVGDAERYSIGACTARIGAVALNVGSPIGIRARPGLYVGHVPVQPDQVGPNHLSDVQMGSEIEINDLEPLAKVFAAVFP